MSRAPARFLRSYISTITDEQGLPAVVDACAGGSLLQISNQAQKSGEKGEPPFKAAPRLERPCSGLYSRFSFLGLFRLWHLLLGIVVLSLGPEVVLENIPWVGTVSSGDSFCQPRLRHLYP